MKKILLLGRHNSGKTSMYRVIFANQAARETVGIGFTVGVDQNLVNLMGNFRLNIWDSGFQAAQIARYLSKDKEIMFGNVSAMIFVFDATRLLEEQTRSEDVSIYLQCLEALKSLSADSQVFILLHKMDLIEQRGDYQEIVIKMNIILCKQSTDMSPPPTIFTTSIWEDSLYSAWSTIMQQLLPSMKQITEELERFCEVSEISEGVLFEKNSFLIMGFFDKLKKGGLRRYERISYILKSFRLACTQERGTFQEISIQQPQIIKMLEFDENTYLLVSSEKQVSDVSLGMIEFNLSSFKKHIKAILQNSSESLQDETQKLIH